MASHLLRSVVVAAFLLVVSVPSFAAFPSLISYQGFLKSDSTPYNGTTDLTFRLYYSSDPGPPPVWLETHTAVTVTNGAFSVMLGSLTPLDSWIFDTGTVYLGIAAGTDQEMTPRAQVAAVPFAFRASQADKVTGPVVVPEGESFSVANLMYVESGKVGIGAGPANANHLLSIYNAAATNGAASMQINNTANPSTALEVTTFGTGSAGSFTLNNPITSSPAVRVSATNGGAAIHSTVIGDGGASSSNHAGYFETTHPSSTSSVLKVVNQGRSNAVHIVNQNSQNGGDVFKIESFGGGDVVNSYSKGATGKAGYFDVVNVNNSDEIMTLMHRGTGHGLYVSLTNTNNNNYAVNASTNGNGAAGRFDILKATSSSPAVYASTSGTGPAGYFVGGSNLKAADFVGNVSVSGTISKAGGTFKIDHPLQPRDKYLYHSFVESPDMKNIYDGIALLDESGRAVVQLPVWFEALNRDFRYQLTALGAPSPGLHISRKMTNNSFEIAGGQAGLEVSWQVTGIRKDAWAEKNRTPVEEDKSPAEKGSCLHNEACQP